MAGPNYLMGASTLLSDSANTVTATRHTQPSAAAQTLWVGLSTFSPLCELLHILQGPIHCPLNPLSFCPMALVSIVLMVITYVPFCPEEQGFPKGDFAPAPEQRPGTKQRILNLARIILFPASFCTLRGFPGRQALCLTLSGSLKPPACDLAKQASQGC